jgi:hypothetical protein
MIRCLEWLRGGNPAGRAVLRLLERPRSIRAGEGARRRTGLLDQLARGCALFPISSAAVLLEDSVAIETGT